MREKRYLRIRYEEEEDEWFLYDVNTQEVLFSSSHEGEVRSVADDYEDEGHELL